tara:strand:+ start:116 stop:217 length:102 start_codon:yes stop_codon:yes gene_type:complete
MVLQPYLFQQQVIQLQLVVVEQLVGLEIMVQIQ